ncbi:transporter substrate-binding domain-containing protein [Sediminicoccus sp. KRV36]|uniref:substrate-binding periplasmic protein n=1 Tax=Sediminicoccus sp. KRV36 TaxID=3133721 RepID=UPI00200EB41A|nr:transporter substrate-binding domain-containing protein [Sediminicoccus rosea]UPY37049.1 transporter substrate-binding domain-containing protein [Sediminicoccus rosea]
MQRRPLTRRTLLAALAGLPLAAARPADAAPDGSLRRVLQAGVLRMGVQIEGTAAASLSAGGVPQGYLPALGRRIASGLGVRAEFVQVPRGEMLDLLVAGRFDLALGGVIAGARAALRSLLSDPIMYFQLLALTPQELVVRGPMDLRGLRIAVLEGRSFAAAIRQAGVVEAGIATVPSWEKAAQALALGEIQVAIVPDHHAVEIQRAAPTMTPRFALGEFRHCCHLNNGEHDLLRALNVLLYLLRQEGELPELHRAFFGRDITVRRTL